MGDFRMYVLRHRYDRHRVEGRVDRLPCAISETAEDSPWFGHETAWDTPWAETASYVTGINKTCAWCLEAPAVRQCFTDQWVCEECYV